MAVVPAQIPADIRDKLGFHDEITYLRESGRGLTRETVTDLSKFKDEPEWMLKFRLRAYDHFLKRPMPVWTDGLDKIDFDKIVYYRKPSDREERSWDDVPEEIKATFEKLGIPEAERKFLSGVGAQYDSEVVYHSVKEELAKLGVVFMGTDQGLKEYPEIFRKYFATVVPPEDNKFAALNSAVWSGGCLTANAMVFTDRGRVSIADIREGDRVFAATPEGNVVLAPVLAQINSGVKRVFKLKVAGQEIEATANHRFLTLRKSDVRLNDHGLLWAQEWRPLSDLRAGDLIAVAKRLPKYGETRAMPLLKPYRRNTNRFVPWKAPTKTSADLMWLLGLWTGDGNTYWSGPDMCRINFALPVEHKGEVRAEAIRVLGDLFGYAERPGTQTKISFTVNSKTLGHWLSEIGFVGKATTKRIPGWIYGLPREERFAFLGGVLDSDGYVENGGRTVSFELSNRDLILDVKALGVTCGLYTNGEIVSRTRAPSFLKKDGRYISPTDSHRCRLQGDLASIGTRTSSKRAALTEAKRTVFDKYRASHGQGFASQTPNDVGFAPIRSIEDLGEAETFDIQVEGLENFVANGIVAHNSFVYVPKGVEVPLPLQAYFRINGENTGQFERTLIVVEEGAKVHYIEGCSAPIYATDSLHAAVVEVVALPGSKVRYTTIQNWSNDVYNLVTKRAHAYANSTVEWIDANSGSRKTVKYPSIYLRGEGASADIISVAVAGPGQHQDTGAKAIHLASNTRSRIVSKSVSYGGGRATYRGQLKVAPGATGVVASVRCDALMLDDLSRSDTYPYIDINEDDTTMTHEATVGKISAEQIFYLMSRGLTEDEAQNLVIQGFLEVFTKELPMEYAIEFNRLIRLEMSGSLG